MSLVLFGVCESKNTVAIAVSACYIPKLITHNDLPHTVTHSLNVSAVEKNTFEHCVSAITNLGISFTHHSGMKLCNIDFDMCEIVYTAILQHLQSAYTVAELSEPPVDVKKKDIVDLTSLPPGMNWIIMSKKSQPKILVP
jgi:hypothetical protein